MYKLKRIQFKLHKNVLALRFIMNLFFLIPVLKKGNKHTQIFYVYKISFLKITGR